MHTITGISRRRLMKAGAATATLPLVNIRPSRAAGTKTLVIVQQPGSLRTVDPGRLRGGRRRHRACAL